MNAGVIEVRKFGAKLDATVKERGKLGETPPSDPLRSGSPTGPRQVDAQKPEQTDCGCGGKPRTQPDTVEW